MSIYQVLVPSRYLPRLAGAAPFGLSKTNVELSILGRIWSFIYLPIIAALLYQFHDELPYKFDSIKNILLTVSFWLKYTLAIFSIIKDGVYQQDIIDVSRAIEDWDKRTGYGNDTLAKRENKNIRFWSYVYSFVLVIFAVTRFFGIYSENVYSWIGNEIVLIQIDNSIQMFSVFATLLGMRFRYFNSIIEKQRGIEVQSSRCPSASNPEHVRSLYLSLVATAEKLNDHYSSRLFWWSGRIMIYLITILYHLAVEEITVARLAIVMPQLVSSLVGLFVFTATCQFTVDQASQISTALLTKNIRLTDRINRGRKEIFTMSVYMTLKPFTFSALGFYSVDLTIACAVCTITITYLVLCVQTGTGLKNDSNGPLTSTTTMIPR